MNENVKFNASFKPVLIVALFILIVIVALFFVREVIIMNRETARLETMLFEEAKQELSMEVENRKEEFSLSMDEAVVRIGETLYSGLERLSMFHQELKVIHNDESVIRSQLLFAARLQSPIMFFEMISEEGLIVQTDGSLSELDNANITVEKDVLQAVLDDDFVGGIVMVDDEKVYTEIIDLTNGDRMIAFVLHDALVAQEKAITIARFQQYYMNADDTLFMIDGKETVLLHSFEDYIGMAVDATQDEIFINAYEIIKGAFENPNQQTGQFIEYRFYKTQDRLVLTDRVAYIALCETFNIIIGKSVPIAFYEDVIAEARTTTRADFYHFVLPIYGILSIAIIAGGFVLNRYVKQSSLTIKEEERLYQTIASRSNQVIVIADDTGKAIFINDTGKSVFNITKDEPLYIVEKIAEDRGRTILVGARQTYYVRLHKESLRLNRRNATLYFFEDVTDEVESEKTLRKAATVDLLTGLYNRRKLLDDFDAYFKPYVEDQKNGVFVILDFDNFKAINDAFGHHYGDNVLTNIGKIFRANSDKTMRFYRMGGDEFAVLATLPRETVMKRLKKVRETLENTTFEHGTPSFSYGISQAKTLHYSCKFSDYYAEADEMLYRFKASG